MRKNANVNCAKPNYQNRRADDCLPLLKPCLFNIAEDPCEQFNLAERFDPLEYLIIFPEIIIGFRLGIQIF